MAASPSRALRSAPNSTSTATTAGSVACNEARCKGVGPRFSRASGSAPERRQAATCPAEADWKKFQLPQSSQVWAAAGEGGGNARAVSVAASATVRGWKEEAAEVAETAWCRCARREFATPEMGVMLGALDLQVDRVRVLQGILHRCAGIGPAGDLLDGVNLERTRKQRREPPRRGFVKQHFHFHRPPMPSWRAQAV